MDVKIKKLHKDAVIPTYANPTDAGMDITAIDYEIDQKNKTTTYKTGLSIEIPEGYVGFLFPRSSVYKMDQTLANCVGVIDSGYRGEIMFKFRSVPVIESNRFHHSINNVYRTGDRIGQMIIMPIPRVNFIPVQKLSNNNNRGGGFGSTGK